MLTLFFNKSLQTSQVFSNLNGTSKQFIFNTLSDFETRFWQSYDYLTETIKLKKVDLLIEQGQVPEYLYLVSIRISFSNFLYIKSLNTTIDTLKNLIIKQSFRGIYSSYFQLVKKGYFFHMAMKRILILLAFLFVITNFSNAKTEFKNEDRKDYICLTVQAENGSIKQKINKDGSITCIIKPNDVIRVSTILLNGEDITNQLEKNKLTIPFLTQNTTLVVSFDSKSMYVEQIFNTLVNR